MGSREDGPTACIFCAIVERKSPAWIVYEDAENLAFLDLFPITRGHLLVVPKRHVDRLIDLPESEYASYFKALTEVCRRVEGLSRHYNVTANQGELAGQIVFHLHFHIMPRYGSDDPFTRRPRVKLEEREARQLVAALQAG